MLKKILLATALATVATDANAETVNVLLDESYEPYTFVDNGKPSGAYVEILKEADKLMPNFELSFEGVPWKRAVAGVEDGSALAVIPPYNTRKTMDYSVDLFEEQVITICNSDEVKAKPASYPVGYRGLVIGNNLGFKSPGEEFFKEVESGNIQLEEARKTEVNLKKLLAGRIDCYINDRLVINGAVSELVKTNSSLKASADKLVEYHVVNGNTTHVGISQKGNYPFKSDFVKELNTAITTLKENGTVDKLIDKYK